LGHSIFLTPLSKPKVFSTETAGISELVNALVISKLLKRNYNKFHRFATMNFSILFHRIIIIIIIIIIILFFFHFCLTRTDDLGMFLEPLNIISSSYKPTETKFVFWHWVQIFQPLSIHSFTLFLTENVFRIPYPHLFSTYPNEHITNSMEPSSS
jgi:small-conductance mechanosensitive channel